MKAKFALIASAILLMSSMATAQENQAPSADAHEHDAPSAKLKGQGMMGHMDKGMMEKGMMRHGMHMRLIFILMDTDGDGALSLEEFQAAHAKMFKGIDVDKDGKVTQTEMQMFFSGSPPTAHGDFDDDD